MSKIKFIAFILLSAIAFHLPFQISESISWNIPTVSADTATSASTTEPSVTTSGSEGLKPGDKDSSCGLSIVCGLKYLLYGVVVFFGWIVWIGATLTEWVIAPSTMAAIGNTVVYTIWKTVRDTLNLMFIFVLLFSAFATIFQVKEFHVKKILLSVVIAALLVNFSFPISRFIIDASNMTMYFIMDQAFQTTSGYALASKIAGGDTSIADQLIKNSVDKYTFSYLFMCIVFMALFAFTFIMIAVLFLIRLVALIILVMFSSVGFVCGILPATKQYSSDWWKNLFRWAFMAPILMFMIAIAIKIMVEMGLQSSIQTNGNASNPNITSALGTFAMYIVPIVVLWMGISSAMKLGKEVAGGVVGLAEKGAKWLTQKMPLMAGKGALGLAGGVGAGTVGGVRGGWRGALSGFGSGFKYGSAAPGGVVKMAKDVYGNVQKKQAAAEEDISGFLRGKSRQVAAKKRAEQIKLWETEGTPEKDIRKLFNAGDATATEYLSKNGKLRNAEDVKKALSNTQKNPEQYKKIVDKISKDSIQGMSAAEFNRILEEMKSSESLRKGVAADLGVEIDDPKVNQELNRLEEKIQSKFGAEGRLDLVIESRLENEKKKIGRNLTDSEQSQIITSGLTEANEERLKAQNWSNYMSVKRGNNMIKVTYDVNTGSMKDESGADISATEVAELNRKMTSLSLALGDMSDSQKKEMIKGMSAKEYAQLKRLTGFAI